MFDILISSRNQSWFFQKIFGTIRKANVITNRRSTKSCGKYLDNINDNNVLVYTFDIHSFQPPVIYLNTVHACASRGITECLLSIIFSRVSFSHMLQWNVIRYISRCAFIWVECCLYAVASFKRETVWAVFRFSPPARFHLPFYFNASVCFMVN